MTITGEILQKRLEVSNILHSGAILNLLGTVTHSGSKELLIIFAEKNGLEKLMTSEARVDVLDFFIDLATILVNTYDERLGVISALVYLLCERDRFSIDIQWSWRDARRFEKFILWLGPLLSYRRARILLNYVLNNFPPLRVTPLMLDALCQILPSLSRELSQIGKSGDDLAVELARGTDIIASIAYFGLGLEIREILHTDLLVYDAFYPKIKDMRCSHNHCELIRRVRRAIKERDESPIPENTSSARRLMAALGSTVRIGEVLSVARLIDCLDVENGSDDWTIDKDDALLNFFSICHVWDNQNMTPSFESVVGNINDLHQVLLKHRYFERYFSLSEEGGRGGLPRGLGLWSVYCLRRTDVPSSVIKELSASWLQLMCDGVAKVRSSNIIPFDDGFLLPFCGCLFAAYTSALEPRPDQSAVDHPSDLCADEFFCSWSATFSATVAKALTDMVSSVQAYMLSSLKPCPEDKFTRHLLFLSCCLGIVCGVGEYGKIPELRRPVILPAAAACGLLTDVCRTFLKIVTEQSRCVMVRRIAEICLMRAEQASGLRLVLA